MDITLLFSFCIIKAGFIRTVSSMSDSKSRGREFKTQRDHITFAEVDHEIISTDILHLPPIQEWQLSVTGEEYVYLEQVDRLGGISLPKNNDSR